MAHIFPTQWAICPSGFDFWAEPCLSLVPKSRSSVKIEKKMAVVGAFVFHKRILFNPLPDNKILDLSKMKAFADDNLLWEG